MIKVKRAVVIAVCLMFSLSLVSPVEVSAKTQSTNLKLDIYAKGVYSREIMEVPVWLIIMIPLFIPRNLLMPAIVKLQ